MSNIIIQQGKELDSIIKYVKSLSNYKSMKLNPLKSRVIFNFVNFDLIVEYQGTDSFKTYIKKDGRDIKLNVNFNGNIISTLDEIGLGYLSANDTITIITKMVSIME
jgi:hypothetical protein